MSTQSKLILAAEEMISESFGGKSKPQGAFDKLYKFLKERDHYDYYGRTKYVQWRDNFFGVEDYQLDQRYGRVIHEVVPHVHVRDWVDDFEDWIDEKFVPFLNGAIKISVTPQKVVV